MKLYIKQKVFSWNDKFIVKDEEDNDAYVVSGEIFSLKRKLHIRDTEDRELANVQQKPLSFMPRYAVALPTGEKLTVYQRMSFLRSKYDVEPIGWRVEGKVNQHEFSIFSGNNTVAVIKKAYFTWGDSYEITIEDPENELAVLSVVLTIDCMKADCDSVMISSPGFGINAGAV